MNDEEVSISCNICGHECTSDTFLLLHINGQHKDKAVLNCTECSYEAGSIDEMIMHEHVAHKCVIENAVQEIVDLPS